jgi:hypothetical protein
MRGNALYNYVENRLGILREGLPRIDGRVFPRVVRVTSHTNPELKSSNFLMLFFIIIIMPNVVREIYRFFSKKISKDWSLNRVIMVNDVDKNIIKPELKLKSKLRVDTNLFEKMKAKQEEVLLNVLSPFQKASQ